MNNKLFLERTELKIETKETTLKFIYPRDWNINNPEILNGLNLKWDYKSINEEPNEFNIKIQGLTTTTISKIQLKDKVKLVAGYGQDIGIVASGIITRKEIEKGILKIKCREVPIKFNKLVSVAFEPKITASQIIKNLANDIGIIIKQCDLKNDKVYLIGESILGSGLYEIGQIVKDCGSEMTTKDDFLYIYHNDTTSKNIIKLSYKSGLLEEPKPKNIKEISYKIEKSNKVKNSQTKDLRYDYEVKCLLIHYLKKGDNIELISNELNSMCKIVEITDISDFVMTIKVLIINR